MTPSSTPTPNNRWVRYRSVAYLRGRGFSYGVKGIFPQRAQAKGLYLLNCAPTPEAPHTPICDEGFEVLAPHTFDYTFLGPSLSEKPSILKEALGKLKPHAHLLTLTTKDLPRETLLEMVAKSGGWRQKTLMERDGLTLGIWKRVPNYRGILPPRTRPAKSACIARYGALGDAVLVTPLVKALKKDGYHVTLNVTPYAAPVYEHNPYVDNYVWQEREAIPNEELGEYWDEWRGEYERYINLSESIEGTLLKLEGRRDFYTTNDHRRTSLGTRNYQDHTMALGGYPEQVGAQGQLFLTTAERRTAKRFRDKHANHKLVLWGLNGSSHHKQYALTQPFLHTYLEQHPDCHVVLLGDDRAKPMEFDHPQVTKGCGAWSLREVMALCEVADCVVGPESAIVNFASCFPTPKIVLLSHSSPDNLTKHWANTIALQPDQTKAPCYPCHQLHYTLESCPLAQIVDEGEVVAEGPACSMGAISMETLAQALDTQLYKG